MYLLIKEENVKNTQVLEMFHERMPDGRLILSISELKMLGSVSDCQIVATAKELKEIISSTPEQPSGTEDDTGIYDGGQQTDADGQNDSNVTDTTEDTESEDGISDETDVFKDDTTNTDTNKENQNTEEVTDNGTGSTGRA